MSGVEIEIYTCIIGQIGHCIGVNFNIRIHEVTPYSNLFAELYLLALDISSAM